MTLSEYVQLKDTTVLSIASSPLYEKLLASIKVSFKDDINSTRRYETITNIRELLNVLEIRDVLSEDNVASLKFIINSIPNNNVLVQKIIDYEVNHVTREQTNLYAPASYQDFSSNVANFGRHSYINCNSCLATISKRKKERIFGIIVEEIGIFWRDLGRNLKIQERVIDEIDINNKTLPSKVVKLLEYYEHKKADPQRWFFHICEALETVRRKDLCKEIQNIMTMNI